MDMVERVRAALLAGGHADTIAAFEQGTPSAADAAAAVGCTVARIAKTIVFRAAASDSPVLVIASGANRVDRRKAGSAAGLKLGHATPEWVLDKTGFAVGGVAPVGSLVIAVTLLDRDLLELGAIWAAAGSPRHVFRTTAADLVRLTGAGAFDIRQDP